MPPKEVFSEELMDGEHELLIIHNGETYRLRVTGNHRLILTK